MTVKKFKPGDWVKIKGNGDAPKTEVLKYISKKNSLTGAINNSTFVKCVHYKNGSDLPVSSIRTGY
jgi:tRNA A37 threonylcarbamoyladenosine biosynthesis protein TsaE